jgi:hypothetical protein
MTLVKIQTGLPFYRPLNAEGPQFNLIPTEGLPGEVGGMWEFVWSASKIAPVELMSFDSSRSGKVEYSLCVVDTIPFISCRTSLLPTDITQLQKKAIILPWQEAPFNIHLVPDGLAILEKTRLQLEERSSNRLAITMAVVDYDDYTVKSLATHTFSPTFSRQLIDVAAQCKFTDVNQYHSHLQKLYRKYQIGVINKKFQLCQCKAGD